MKERSFSRSSGPKTEKIEKPLVSERWRRGDTIYLKIMFFSDLSVFFSFVSFFQFFSVFGLPPVTISLKSIFLIHVFQFPDPIFQICSVFCMCDRQTKRKMFLGLVGSIAMYVQTSLEKTGVFVFSFLVLLVLFCSRS